MSPICSRLLIIVLLLSAVSGSGCQLIFSYESSLGTSNKTGPQSADRNNGSSNSDGGNNPANKKDSSAGDSKTNLTDGTTRRDGFSVSDAVITQEDSGVAGVPPQCNGVDTDLTSDPLNCGNCGNKCTGGTPQCCNGFCLPSLVICSPPANQCTPKCANGLYCDCGNRCIDLSREAPAC